LAAIGCLLASVVLVPAATAAETKVGQLFTPTYACGGPNSYLQTGVASGNSYTVPVSGVITSWSFQAGATPVAGLKLKVGRFSGTDVNLIADSAAGTQTPNAVNTYSANIPVQAGDMIGLLQISGNCAVQTADALDKYLFSSGDIAPGTTMPWGPFTGFKFPVQATVTSPEPAPSNSFTFGGLKRNLKKGTAKLTVNVPGPGTLTLTGKGVVKQRPAASASKTVTAAGAVKLLVKAKGKQKRTLNRTGKVKVKAKVTYTPTGGSPNTKTKRIKLIKRL
jgi:hypothetical protein